jgi:hypothetical protein
MFLVYLLEMERSTYLSFAQQMDLAFAKIIESFLVHVLLL